MILLWSSTGKQCSLLFSKGDNSTKNNTTMICTTRTDIVHLFFNIYKGDNSINNHTTMICTTHLTLSIYSLKSSREITPSKFNLAVREHDNLFTSRLGIPVKFREHLAWVLGRWIADVHFLQKTDIQTVETKYSMLPPSPNNIKLFTESLSLLSPN